MTRNISKFAKTSIAILSISIANITLAENSESPAPTKTPQTSPAQTQQASAAQGDSAQTRKEDTPKVPLKVALKERAVKSERGDVVIADFKSITAADSQKAQMVTLPYLNCILYFAPDAEIDKLDSFILSNMPAKPSKGITKQMLALEKYLKTLKVSMDVKPYSHNAIKQSIQGGIPAIVHVFVLLKDLDDLKDQTKKRAETPSNKDWSTTLKKSGVKLKKANTPAPLPLVVIGFNLETKEVLLKQGIQEPIWIEESDLKSIAHNMYIFDL